MVFTRIYNHINKMLWKESVISNGNGSRQLLHDVSHQMPALNAVACVPAYHQHMLLAILLLGEKHDKMSFDQEELDFFSALAKHCPLQWKSGSYSIVQSSSTRNLLTRSRICSSVFDLSSDCCSIVVS